MSGEERTCPHDEWLDVRTMEDTAVPQWRYLCAACSETRVLHEKSAAERRRLLEEE